MKLSEVTKQMSPKYLKSGFANENSQIVVDYDPEDSWPIGYEFEDQSLYPERVMYRFGLVLAGKHTDSILATNDLTAETLEVCVNLDGTLEFYVCDISTEFTTILNTFSSFPEAWEVFKK